MPHAFSKDCLTTPVVQTDGSERNVKRADGTEYDSQIHEKTLKAQKAREAQGSRGGPKPKESKS